MVSSEQVAKVRESRNLGEEVRGVGGDSRQHQEAKDAFIPDTVDAVRVRVFYTSGELPEK